MTAEVWIPLLSGFVGALVGGASSVLVVLIQAGRDRRRHLQELAMQMAVKEWENHAAIVLKRGGALGPMSYYLAEAFKTMKMIEARDGNLSPADHIQAAVESRLTLQALVAADPNRPSWADEKKPS
ncbi:hypothetical protein [Mesorhizobium sp. J428]|uniref:hypothetical protein n=1 Tax=Mesorhizobium sp. J428 TaxID=2898440 RepID=UPI0021515400|nr:hypothetical protein [Mesorhizobium sp. J428]MCR5859758.1 hypothetical protein [Mesorhizobium sp. J428]